MGTLYGKSGREGNGRVRIRFSVSSRTPQSIRLVDWQHPHAGDLLAEGLFLRRTGERRARGTPCSVRRKTGCGIASIMPHAA
jgi:hypothetical protein